MESATEQSELAFRRMVELADADIRISRDLALSFDADEDVNEATEQLIEAGIWNYDLTGGKYRLIFNGDRSRFVYLGPYPETNTDPSLKDDYAVIDAGSAVVVFRDEYVAARIGTAGRSFDGALITADELIRLTEYELDCHGYRYK